MAREQIEAPVAPTNASSKWTIPASSGTYTTDEFVFATTDRGQMTKVISYREQNGRSVQTTTDISNEEEASKVDVIDINCGITEYTNAIRVGVGQIRRLRQEDQRIIWTEDLQSCFPVVYKYKNGDIALYHANSTGFPDDETFHTDVEEIMVFSKSGSPLNKRKSETYVELLKERFRKSTTNEHPRILINEMKDRTPYSGAACGFAADGKPIVVIANAITHSPAQQGVFQPINLLDAPVRKLISTYYAYEVNSQGLGRKHKKEVMGNNRNFSLMKEDLKKLNGDVLKSTILREFKERIEQTTDSSKLKELKKELQEKAEYQVLAKSQGRWTRDGNTSSVKAFEKMFKEQENYIENNNKRTRLS